VCERWYRLGPGVRRFVGRIARQARSARRTRKLGDERWNRVIDINLNGIFATVRAAARQYEAAQVRRIIVHDVARSTHVEPAIGSAYMAAKAGAAHFMRSAALELAGYNITVNAIAPDSLSPTSAAATRTTRRRKKAVRQGHSYASLRVSRGPGGTGVVFRLAWFRYITGQEVIIDGGWGLGKR